MAVNIVGAREEITGGLTNINSDHAIIHMGYGGLASDYLTLTDGQVKDYCFTGPLNSYPHFKNIDLHSLGGSVKLEIIKGATVSANTGDAITVTNPNDNAPYIVESTIKENPTSTGGTVWKAIYALADTTRQSVGNANTSESDNQELIMKKGNEQYIIRITNLTSSDVPVAWTAFWYEEEKGLSK